MDRSTKPFNYDPIGNRTNSNQNGSSTFNQANQLLEDANFTYQYDNNGNLTRKTPKTPGPFNVYEYDAENKLVRAVINGTTVNYRYDGLGRRVEKEVISVGTSVTRYVNDNEDILLELDGSNQVVARYTHGPGIDEPLIMEKNSQSFYYHADGLGSITELTNQSGAVAQRYMYSSFGKIESQLDPNFAQPYTFTSREFDPETGLLHYRERYYDPAIGRFLSEDPLRGAATSPQSLNRYPYVSNNPATFFDPWGLQQQSANPCEGPACNQSVAECYSNCVFKLFIDPLSDLAKGIILGTAATHLAGNIPRPAPSHLNYGQWVGGHVVYNVARVLGTITSWAAVRGAVLRGVVLGGAVVAGAGVVTAAAAGDAIAVEAYCLAACAVDACSY